MDLLGDLKVFDEDVSSGDSKGLSVNFQQLRSINDPCKVVKAYLLDGLGAGLSEREVPGEVLFENSEDQLLLLEPEALLSDLVEEEGMVLNLLVEVLDLLLNF